MCMQFDLLRNISERLLQRIKSINKKDSPSLPEIYTAHSTFRPTVLIFSIYMRETPICSQIQWLAPNRGTLNEWHSLSQHMEASLIQCIEFIGKQQLNLVQCQLW